MGAMGSGLRFAILRCQKTPAAKLRIANRRPDPNPNTNPNRGEMSEFVGIKSLFDLVFTEDLSGQLKREALLVDKIAILDFEVVLRDKGSFAEDRDELLWLYEQGVVFKPPDVLRMPYPILDPLFDDIVHYLVHENISLKELERRGKRQRQKYKFVERGMLSSQMQTRLTSIYLREKEEVDNCALFSRQGHPELLKFRSAPRRDASAIVLNALPVPNATTPWEHIAEYRIDPDSHSKFLALRNWINDLSRTDLQPLEIEQKLEYLIDQYRKQMALHKIKTHKGPVETIVVSSTELLENIVKLKWSKVAKKLFSFRQRKIALLETELAAPGREVAYIVDARERFS
jgi:hypothetical protein